LIFAGCRQDSEIKDAMRPAAVCAEAAYRVLSIHHIPEQYSLHWNDEFLTPQTRKIWVDSIYSDGDGKEFILDFGTGVLCTDGIKRKGKCRIITIDSALPFKGNSSWIAEKTDSFFIFSKNGWEHIFGFFSWEKINSDSVSIQFSLHMASNKNVFVKTEKPLAIIYGQPFEPYKTGQVWSGEWKTEWENKTYIVNTTELINSGACRSNWNKGLLQISEGSETWTADTDPFGNSNCDIVFKITKGSGLKTDEMTFDAW
jgi:hypothetical protein